MPFGSLRDEWLQGRGGLPLNLEAINLWPRVCDDKLVTDFISRRYGKTQYHSAGSIRQTFSARMGEFVVRRARSYRAPPPRLTKQKVTDLRGRARTDP